MEAPALIKKMTTKNLLALYRAERKRMYKRGYRTMVDEDDNGLPLKELVWINNSGSDKHFANDVEYFTMLKTELASRPHEPNKQKSK